MLPNGRSTQPTGRSRLARNVYNFGQNSLYFLPISVNSVSGERGHNSPSSNAFFDVAWRSGKSGYAPLECSGSILLHRYRNRPLNQKRREVEQAVGCMRFIQQPLYLLKRMSLSIGDEIHFFGCFSRRQENFPAGWTKEGIRTLIERGMLFP